VKALLNARRRLEFQDKKPEVILRISKLLSAYQVNLVSNENIILAGERLSFDDCFFKMYLWTNGFSLNTIALLPELCLQDRFVTTLLFLIRSLPSLPLGMLNILSLYIFRRFEVENGKLSLSCL